VVADGRFYQDLIMISNDLLLSSLNDDSLTANLSNDFNFTDNSSNLKDNPYDHIDLN